MLASAIGRTSQWVSTASWSIQDNLYWPVMELYKIDYYTNQVVITQSMVRSLHNQLLVMSSALLFVRDNTSGERELIVQNINSIFLGFFFFIAIYSVIVEWLMHQASGANSESLWLNLFWEPFSVSDADEFFGELVVLYWIASTCSPDGCSFQRISLSLWLWACCYKLLHWHPDISWKKIGHGLGSAFFPACSTRNTSKTIFEAWDSDLKGWKIHPRQVQQRICRTALISMRFWPEVPKIFLILWLSNISVEITNTACGRIHLYPFS